ncbi:CPBP family intramembrane glutamic endopeptidase [uncultured Gemmiger sp.]|uniref:CPBP family intramembrane glutamic endopeptidase n=1 Tax=uncultured Gemmiger sp. TaxID=1623490 RepID=UPI0025DB29EB|nr:CPBP family intramembrane glutamic endopeptidase [uncultured Gemmiger sp.]
MARVRGVRGAAGVCALAAILYLLARSVLTLLVSGIMGLIQPGASLAHAAGFGEVGVILLQTLVGIGALALPLWWLLCSTRLQIKDMRIMIPTAWSPGFCLPVFLGLANAGNLLGGLLCRIFGVEQPGALLAGGGAELFLQFVSLCLVPAVTEELFFRGALQGLLRPSGSAAAIFGTALLFGLLHLDLAQGLTAFISAVFLGWLAERSGSILPGMLLHFVNNSLAFLTLYLRLYAPAAAAMAVELFILLFFPVFAVWLIWHARGQGFRFSAGLRPGVDALNVFTSPVYSATVIFLVAYAALL